MKPKTGIPKPSRERSHIEDKLDEALKESFPASDPVALSEPGPAEPPKHSGTGQGKKSKK